MIFYRAAKYYDYLIIVAVDEQAKCLYNLPVPVYIQMS
mgnify:FL=1